MKYNNATTINRIILICAIFTLLQIPSCSQQKEREDKIGVVVSILPLADFVEKIGGDKVMVSVMVPPGASPHTYEPTPSQLVDVSNATIYIKVGTAIEFELIWLDKILSVNKKIFVVDASAGIKLQKMDHENEEDAQAPHHGLYDPHIWVSPKNAKIIIENIYHGLAAVDPKNRTYYTTNKESYQHTLNSLDRDIEQIVFGKKNRRFMVYHPSWGYFAGDYNLEQISVEAAGKEPTAQRIQQIIDEAKNNDIKIVFASPQFTTLSAEVIAREIKGRVILIDPLEKDFILNMKKVAQVLAAALN